VVLCGLGGLIAGGEWRWLAVPALVFAAIAGARALRLDLPSGQDLGQTDWRLLDLVDFPGRSPFLFAADGRALYAGSRWQDWTGMEVASVIDGRWLEAVHPHERDGVRQAWSNSLASGQLYDREFRVLFRDGRFHWMRARADACRDDEHRITHWAGVLDDIHERRMEKSNFARPPACWK
jgi:PAS domain S-box-containing protein